MKFNRILSAFAATALIMTASSCSQQAAVDAEIKVPVLESGSASAFSTATVQVTDIEETTNVGGSIGYVYADHLYTQFESNVVEVVAKRGESLKEGDVIEITMGANTTKIQVTKVVEHATKDDAGLMYKVL